MHDDESGAEDEMAQDRMGLPPAHQPLRIGRALLIAVAVIIIFTLLAVATK